MRDNSRLIDTGATVAAIKPSSDTETRGSWLLQASDRDLLIYMGDLLSELTGLAVNARFEGLADLLGYAHREIERNRNARQSGGAGD